MEKTTVNKHTEYFLKREKTPHPVFLPYMFSKADYSIKQGFEILTNSSNPTQSELCFVKMKVHFLLPF